MKVEMLMDHYIGFHDFESWEAVKRRGPRASEGPSTVENQTSVDPSVR